jgi:hypothetical protein
MATAAGAPQLGAMTAERHAEAPLWGEQSEKANCALYSWPSVLQGRPLSYAAYLKWVRYRVGTQRAE